MQLSPLPQVSQQTPLPKFPKLSGSRDPPVATSNLFHCFTALTLGKGVGEECLTFFLKVWCSGILIQLLLSLEFICLIFIAIFKLVTLSYPCSPSFCLNSFLLQVVDLCDQKQGAKSGRGLDVSPGPQCLGRRGLDRCLMAGCVG